MAAEEEHTEPSASSSGDGVASMSGFMTVSEAYDRAHSLMKAIDGSGPPDPAARAKRLEAAIRAFIDVEVMIDRAALFSRNETMDDVQTNCIKFLLVPAILAELALKNNDRVRRVKTLERAKALYRRFLAHCDELGILEEADRKAFRRETEGDASGVREEKIERFKRDRVAQQKLAELARRKGARAAEGAEGPDEELERELWTMLVQSACRKALDETRLIEQERTMLVEMEKLDPERFRASLSMAPGAAYNEQLRRDEASSSSSGGAGSSSRGGGRGQRPIHITDAAGAAAAAAAMNAVMNRREEIRRGVIVQERQYLFPDEVPMETLLRGGRVLSGGTEPKKAEEEEDSDREEVSDRKTLKARNWDDWKDENPRGAGNTIR
eukprot:tig00021127_g18684.t1